MPERTPDAHAQRALTINTIPGVRAGFGRSLTLDVSVALEITSEAERENTLYRAGLDYCVSKRERARQLL